MTQEEKQILLKDLCARLLYRVKLNFYAAATKENYTCTLLGIEPNDDKSIIAKVDSGAFMFPAEHIKPYLRPMSSMTDEEKTKIASMAGHFNDLTKAIEVCFACLPVVDYCYSRHLDIHGLIEKGLALEAPEAYQQEILNSFDTGVKVGKIRNKHTIHWRTIEEATTERTEDGCCVTSEKMLVKFLIDDEDYRIINKGVMVNKNLLCIPVRLLDAHEDNLE